MAFLNRGGKRIYAANAKPMIKGLYSSDPHVLTRLDINGIDDSNFSAMGKVKTNQHVLFISPDDSF